MCTDFLQANVSAILYLVNYETFGRSTASAQYFLQLAGYLGIPVISWNADNSGLERTASQSRLQIQLGNVHRFRINQSNLFEAPLYCRMCLLFVYFEFEIRSEYIYVESSELFQMIDLSFSLLALCAFMCVF